MSSWNDLVSQVLSTRTVIAAMFGAVADRIVWRVHDRWMDHKEPECRPHRTTWERSTILIWALGGFVLCYMVFETEQTHQATVAEAHRALSCEQHIVAAAVARDKLNDSLNDLASADRVAQQDWLTQITSPPPEIAAHHTTDPEYQSWALMTTAEYSHRLSANAVQRKQVDAELLQHPLPQEACGNTEEG